MTSYIIAGSSDCKETTECEKIARAIKRLYGNIDFKLILKHPTEWKQCIHRLCEHYGFKELHNPIIFTSDGKLIGGIKDFYQLAQEKFALNKEMIIDKFDHHVNMRIADEDYYERHRQKNLMEKIIKKYSECLSNRLVKKVEGFFEEKEEFGLIFYVKKIADITPTIYIDPIKKPPQVAEEVIEDIEIDFKEKTLAEINELKAKFEKSEAIKAPVESKLDSTRELLTIPDQDSKKESIIITTYQETMQIEEESKLPDNDIIINNHNNGDIEELNNQDVSIQERDIDQPLVKPLDIKAIENIETENSSSRLSAHHQIQEVVTSYRGKVPTPAEFIDLKDYIIDSLDDNFFLAIHPYPLLEGQCVLFHKFRRTKNDNTNTDIEIGLLDYSRCNRKHIVNKRSKFENGYYIKHNIFQKSSEAKTSLLNKNGVDLYDPLTGSDWIKIYNVIIATDSYGIIQYLPREKISHLKMSCGIVNIFPRKFLLKEYTNYGILNLKNPLIDQLPFEYIIYKSLEKQIKNRKSNMKTSASNTNGIASAGGSGNNTDRTNGNAFTFDNIYQVDELPYLHAIAILEEKPYDDLFLGKIYEQLFEYLDNKYFNQELKNQGINLIINKNWVMLVPLTNPIFEQEDKHFYMLPCSFLGYILLPVFENIWPHCPGINQHQLFERSIVEMLDLTTEIKA